MTNKNVFATNLKRLMALRDKSRKDISQDLNISYYTVTDWVNGKKYPRMDKVERLAIYFGVLKSDLIEEKKTDDSINSDIQSELVADFKTLSEDDQKKAIEYVKLLKKASE